MKVKILVIIEILLAIILLKFSITFALNKNFINNYNNKKYNEEDLAISEFLNIEQPYIVHYNKGNILYKNGKYNEAIEEYNKSLNLYPPEKKECKIRINIALSKIAMLEKDDEEHKKKNIETLKSARYTLCEKGCANENDNNGHSKDAEKLKQDIDKKLNELENTNNTPSNQNEPENKPENKQEETKEEQLKKLQQEALKNRQQELENNERLWNYDPSYILYDGKRW